MDKLPKLYTNIFDKKIDNSQELLKISNKEENIKSNIDIRKKIDSIFKSNSFIYKKNVRITFNDKIEDYILIGKTNNNLITMDNQIININNIIDIKEVD